MDPSGEREALTKPERSLDDMTEEGTGFAMEQLFKAGAPACIACGQCEGVCPRHLPIIELLREASAKPDA